MTEETEEQIVGQITDALLYGNNETGIWGKDTELFENWYEAKKFVRDKLGKVRQKERQRVIELIEKLKDDDMSHEFDRGYNYALKTLKQKLKGENDD